MILRKVSGYIIEGTKLIVMALHYLAVNQTVREAEKVLFFPPSMRVCPTRTNIAHRMMGSSIGLVLAHFRICISYLET